MTHSRRFYALAALDFGCRAWSSRRVHDIWMSGLAAALLVGAKSQQSAASFAVGPARGAAAAACKKRAVVTAAVALIAALVSFLPTAALKRHYCHDWSGLNLERAGNEHENPFVGIWGNALLFLMGQFRAALFFPLGAGGGTSMRCLFCRTRLLRRWVANFEDGFHILGELPIEDTTGIGFGISVLVASSF